MPATEARRRRLTEAAAVGAVVVLLALSVAAEGPEGLRTDQQIVNLMVLKLKDPERFRRDPLYGRHYERFYVQAFVGAQSLLATDGEPVTGLRRIAYVLGPIFYLGHYLCFRALGAPALAAGLGGLMALPIRNAIGGDYWGYRGLASVDPRTLANALTPLLLLGLLRWRARGRVLAYFALCGLVIFVHPVSALHLWQVGALAHLLRERARLRAWLEVGGGAVLFTLVGLPYLRVWLTRDNLTDPALLPLIRQIQEYRWPDLFLPVGVNTLLSVAFHMLLPALALGALVKWGALTPTLRSFALLGVLALGLAFAGTALVQGWAHLVDRPYLTYQQLRAAKLVYPALLVGFPFALHHLWGRRRLGPRAAAVALVALGLVPPGHVIHSFSAARRDEVKRRLGVMVPVTAPAAASVPDGPVAPAALCAWARGVAPDDALFFTDGFSFRVAARRAITGAFKDGGMMDLAGTRALLEWYQRMRRVAACRARAGEGCWFELAVETRADFVLVDPSLGRAVAPGGFGRVWERDGWSVWKRLRE